MAAREHLNWVELSQNNWNHNIKLFESICGEKTKVTPVIKSNAYGHGWSELLGFCRDYGVDEVAVNSIHEALAIHHSWPEVRVLIMGHIAPSDRRLAGVANFTVVCSSLAEIEDFQKLKQSPRLELKIDTGMNRLGFLWDDLPLSEIKKLSSRFAGAMTHFANIEDVTENEFGQLQLNRFLKALADLGQAGIQVERRHAASSAAALIFPEARLDMVRIGIAMYGTWPSAETRISASAMYDTLPSLLPVMSFKTKIASIKEVAAGEFVGYGITWKANRHSKVAVLPVGYFEGYPRHLSNCGKVWLHGMSLPVVGRVCMNMMMIDVTDCEKAKLYDEVIVLGGHLGNGQEISALEAGRLAGTINYEVLTRVHADHPRVIV